MQVWEIPLSPVAQRFAITLGGARLHVVVAWRNLGGAGWVLDLEDGEGVPLVSGLPLVTGSDLLAQHRHLGIPGGLFVQTDADPDAVPTYANLGRGSHLYFVQRDPPDTQGAAGT